MACLLPNLCGLEKAECQRFMGLRWTQKGPADAVLGSLATGPTPGQLFVTTDRRFDEALDTGLELSGGSLFEFGLREGGGYAWTADAETGDAGEVRRVGDRLYYIDDCFDSMTTSTIAKVVVATLDGKLLWSKTIGAPGASFCAHHVAVDADNNVYFETNLCEGEYKLDRTYKHRLWGGVEGIVTAFDASGNERWRTVPLYDDSKLCWLGANSNIVDLRVIGGKLLGMNRECIFEIDRATGKRIAEHSLFAFAERGDLASDAQGNVYVGGSSDRMNSLPQPDALTPGQKVDALGQSLRLFVSKYGPDLKHVWTRPITHGSASFVAFDVAANGGGYLVATKSHAQQKKQSFLIRFDVDGRATATGHFEEFYSPTALVLGVDSTPYVGGKFVGSPADGSGLFVWNTTFVNP